MESKFSMPRTDNLPAFPGHEPPQPPPPPEVPPLPDDVPPAPGESMSPQIVSATPVLSIPPLVDLPAPDWRARLADLREKFAEGGHLSVPTRRLGTANKITHSRNGLATYWRDEEVEFFSLTNIVQGQWFATPARIADQGRGKNAREAYRAFCRTQRLARHDTADLLHEIGILKLVIRTDVEMVSSLSFELAGQRTAVTDLKHQLANREQEIEFARHLAAKADPKALPRATPTTRKLQKQIDQARSFLCAADAPPLPLEDQCKWIAARLVSERQARVQAEGKLQAAERTLDDLSKAADSLAAN